MTSVEEAYAGIGKVLLAWAPSDFKTLIFRAPIYRDRCGGMDLEAIVNGVRQPLKFDWDGVDILNSAALRLRDDMKRSTGKRIWGLTFTLHLSGNFNVDYDYTVPEGYEETDETISLSDAMKRLGANLEHDGPKQD